MQPDDDPYDGLLKLKNTTSPHATIWEHRDVTHAYHYKVGALFSLFYLLYILLCFAVMIFVKYNMVSIRFNFVFLSHCDNINGMFDDRDDYL